MYKEETMHHSFLPLPQTSSPCSNAMNSNPVTSPIPLVETKTHILPQLVPCQEAKVESRFFLGDHHFANARSSMLLDSLSKEEAAQAEEGSLLLPYDWMYSEIDADTPMKSNQTMANHEPISQPYGAETLTTLLVDHFPNPIPRNSYEHTNAQTTPMMNHFFSLSSWDFESDYQYQSQDFMMFKIKVTHCRKNLPHDQDKCTYAHVGERSARRDPLKYTYLGELCEEFNNTGQCHFAEQCRKAHGVFEFWLHPTRYRTKMCDRGTNCWRLICFFAHSAEEKRLEVYDDDVIVPSCDDEWFKFGNIGAAKLFGGFMPNPSSEKGCNDSKPTLGYGDRCSKGVKLEFVDGDNQGMTDCDVPEVILDIIEELGIL